MPGAPRREIVAEGEIGAYHCMARCVRRAYLCGRDSVTGKSFEHRKAWVCERLEFLAGSFAIDVASFAVMDNHLHVLLKQRPDVAKTWSAEEITRRWRLIFSSPAKSKVDRDNLQARIDIEATDAKLVKQRRDRLSSISWFMRCLCEPLARRANREDNCKGRFWEGRFRSQALLDDAAVLACSAYVDLNPIRAGITKTPEASRFTSIHERIAERTKPAKRVEESRDGWLSVMEGPTKNKRPSERRASNDELIPLGLDEYLALLDWTGRQIRQDKRGATPAELAPILDRLKIQPASWVDVVTNFGRWFKHAVGSTSKLSEHARLLRRSWLQGIGPSRSSFH